MTIIPLSKRSRTRTHSPLLFDWRARDLSLDARTGQAGTLARAATKSGNATDGTAITFVNGQPAFASVDTNADAVRDALALAMGTTSALTYTYAPAPRAALHYTRFVERGTVTTANARVWELGDASGPNRLIVYNNGGVYAFFWQDGSGNTAGNSLAAAPAAGDLVELLLVQASTGVAYLHQSIAAAAPTSTAAGAAVALTTAYSAQRLRLNADGAASPGNRGANDFLAHRIAPLPAGTYTAQEYLDYMRRL